MKKLPLALLMFLFTFNSIESNAQQTSSNNTTNFYGGSYDDFLREARKQDKVAILDFWASWCAPCKKMDKETFANAELAKHLNEKFLIYKVNVDTFDGMEIANRFGVESFPTVITLDSHGRFIDELKGFFAANHLTEKLNQSSEQPQTYVSL
ncbi:MAG: thioredoxin 1 [Spirosomataceae bacterium]